MESVERLKVEKGRGGRDLICVWREVACTMFLSSEVGGKEWKRRRHSHTGIKPTIPISSLFLSAFSFLLGRVQSVGSMEASRA